MKKLTKIEILDRQFPGLAEEVRKRFAEGISCKKIAELLVDRYGLSLSHNPVETFRARRWAPEQRLIQEKKIAALVVQEIAREKAVRDSLKAEVSGEVK
jgi:cytochrome c-type biogenesis protein CcmH/NrfF